MALNESIFVYISQFIIYIFTIMKLYFSFKDIRFWIVFFFLIRLIGITNPPLEVAHNWRQTTVTMVARNFLEADNNILYPRIDIAGEKSGITGMEFPILNYLIFLFSKIFGYQHWYGRLINLLISSIGIFYFYKLVKQHFSASISFNASIILIVSIWFQFSRKSMPDTFAMSLIIMGIYYGFNYLKNNNLKRINIQLVWYFIFVLIGVLSKLPTGYLLSLFLFLLFDKEIVMKRKLIFCFVSIVLLVPVFWWYFNWVPFLVERFGFWHFFMGKSMFDGMHEILHYFKDSSKKFYDTAIKFIGFFFFLVGLVYTFIKKEKKLQKIFILSFLVFCIIVLKSGFTFAQHSYYIIPFVPIMALMAGYGIDQIKLNRLKNFVLIIICIEGIGNQFHDFIIHENDAQILTLEKTLDSFSPRKDLIVINSGDYPTPMYFAHRKGWVTCNDSIANREYISKVKSKGLKYIVILKRSFGSNLELPVYTRIFNNEDYAIYKP